MLEFTNPAFWLNGFREFHHSQASHSNPPCHGTLGYRIKCRRSDWFWSLERKFRRTMHDFKRKIYHRQSEVWFDSLSLIFFLLILSLTVCDRNAPEGTRGWPLCINRVVGTESNQPNEVNWFAGWSKARFALTHFPPVRRVFLRKTSAKFDWSRLQLPRHHRDKWQWVEDEKLNFSCTM